MFSTLTVPAVLLSTASASAEDGWYNTIGERIRNSALSFERSGEDWRAEHAGFTAVLEHGGAVVSRRDGDGTLRLRVASWGRPGASVPLSALPAQAGVCTPARGAEGDCIRRIERAHPGLDEWWIALEEGLEFGFDVHTRPEGSGPLVFGIALEGATLDEGSGAVWLTDDSGGLWTMSDLLAWDADGEPMPAWLRLDGDRIELVVDDEGARWPITVDPVLTTASTTLSGSSSDEYGYSVSGAGDVNSDGYDDVIVGAQAAYSDTGRAYVYHGSASGVSTSSSATLTGVSSSDNFGCSVSGAGDVNGDGYDDVIVGAYNAESSGGGEGEAYTYHGSASGISSVVADTLESYYYHASFGYSVSGAGDVNGDGYDDVIVGDPYGSSEMTGGALLFYGSSSGISGSDEVRRDGYFWFFIGYSVSGAGDVNGDGYDDIIVGAPGESTLVYVYEGSASGIGSYPDHVWSGPYYEFGAAVSGAGDVNGDGYDDIIIGDYSSSEAHIYLGSSSGPSASVDLTLSGSGYFGRSVSGAGDVNGDGYDDIIIGDDDGGEAHIYLGSSSGLSSSAAVTLSGTGDFGRSVSGAGDVDADGYSDVIVGAYGAGAAYVFHGTSSDADGDGISAAVDCDDSDASVGAPSTWYRDADGDTYGDPDNTEEGCDRPTGYIADDSDCDDSDATVGPASTWHRDADFDTYGDPDNTEEGCDRPTGYIADNTDCDDSDATVYPGAEELPDDGIDQDCDGADLTTDEDDSGVAGDSGAPGPGGDDSDQDGKGGGACAVISGASGFGALWLSVAGVLRRRREQ